MPYAQTRNALKQCLRIKKEDDEIEKISSPPLEIYFFIRDGHRRGIQSHGSWNKPARVLCTSFLRVCEVRPSYANRS